MFVDDMVHNMESHKVSTQNLLELINEFTKITIYNINIQKAILFLFTLAMKYQKKSVKDIKSHQNFKIPRNTFNQGGERSIH